MYALGYPDDARVGRSGLERAFDARLSGAPGGVLLAGHRVLATGRPRPGMAVRTSVSAGIERAALDALAGRLGGIVALSPRTGEILGFAGIAFSGLQPPGSTFKLVTLTGVLEQGLATSGTVFPYATFTTLSGVKLANAHGESCGGTLAMAFATSCNSVFAPLGARLGAVRLVDVARRFGFNRLPGVPGAQASTIPPAEQIGDDLAVGSTAIGQGRVLASPLQMALVAATIGLGGRRPRPTLERSARPATLTPVTSARVAQSIERLMVGVVSSGTGTAARIPGVEVAGKTGTAELRSTHRCAREPADTSAAEEPCRDEDPTDTDAWFVAYAPAGGDPRICVGVMLVGAGAGGETAAPAARRVLLAGLARRS
jgi:cell division protein FtsI/penicillin-binding protein 2